jgi:hypothetical protein
MVKINRKLRVATKKGSTFLEHIFKKMGSTENVMSSVRLSVCDLFLGRYST